MRALLLAFPRFFIDMFNSEPELLAEGVPAMHLYFFGIFMMSLQFAGQSTFYCTGKSKTSRILLIVALKAIIVIPLTLWLPTERTWNKWSLSCASRFPTSSAEPPALSR
ncbi:MAG: MATE family efflux transporter [Dorea sp.]